MKVRAAVIVALAGVAGCGPVGYWRVEAGTLSITYAMIPAPGSRAEAAAYLMIQNRDTIAAALTSVRSPDADSIELYDGATNRAVAQIEVRPRTRLQLAPGGHYLLLKRTRRLLAAGDTVALQLTFAPGGAMTVRAPVVPFIATGGSSTNDLVWWCAALAAAGDDRMELAYFWASILLVLLPTGVFGTIGFYVARAAYRHHRAEQAARHSAA